MLDCRFIEIFHGCALDPSYKTFNFGDSLTVFCDFVSDLTILRSLLMMLPMGLCEAIHVPSWSFLLVHFGDSGGARWEALRLGRLVSVLTFCTVRVGERFPFPSLLTSVIWVWSHRNWPWAFHKPCDWDCSFRYSCCSPFSLISCNSSLPMALLSVIPVDFRGDSLCSRGFVTLLRVLASWPRACRVGGKYESWLFRPRIPVSYATIGVQFLGSWSRHWPASINSNALRCPMIC